MKAFGIAQTILCASTVASALFAPTPTTPHEGHEHVARRRTEKRWYHDDDHPVRRLFVRQDGGNTAEYGTPEWAHAYPTGTPTPDQIPQDWLDALKAAQDAGKIPDFPPTTVQNDNPVYPEGSDPNGPEICSSYYKCRADGTLWDAPEGKFGVGFDDGPYDGTTKLMDFLTEQQQAATHFIIGLYITYYPDEFKRIFDSGDDIAVHTYTHPHMSSLSNEDLVAQFGWTLQIISDATGGRIPRYWRPPYGDSDNRVFAIAKEVFGLEAILWNQDTEDWSLTTGGTTLQTINSSMHDWLTGPKSPGLIVLEHELSLDSVQAFMDAYPVMKENNWDLVSVVDFGSYDHVYQNSDDNTADVTSTSILAPYETGSGSSSDADSTTKSGSDSDSTTESGSSATGSHSSSSTKATSGASHATSAAASASSAADTSGSNGAHALQTPLNVAILSVLAGFLFAA